MLPFEETLHLVADRAEELRATLAAQLLRQGGAKGLRQAWTWRQSRDPLLEQLSRQAWAEAPEAVRAAVLAEVR